MGEPFIITKVTPVTATVEGPRAAYMLQEADCPRQFDPVRRCWLTSWRSVPDLEAFLTSRRRRYVVRELLT